MILTNGTSGPATAAAAADPSADARVRMTTLSARGYMKIRHVLVQLPRGESVRVSTLGRLFTARKHRALVLYLMLLMCWPWLKDQRTPLEATVWVRALTTPKGPTWSPSTLSRAWADLKRAGLVTGVREGRNLRITPRREDSQDDYEIPAGRSDRWNTYFVLPDTFWLDKTFASLTFPGLAMLLIIAAETSRKPEFALAYDWAKDWYGISPKSVQNGIRDLETHGLVHKREEQISAPLSPTGFTTRIHYSLTGQYGQQARAAMQKHAKKERDRRTRPRAARTVSSNAASSRNSVRTVRRVAARAKQKSTGVSPAPALGPRRQRSLKRKPGGA